jgi:hypothetical protein
MMAATQTRPYHRPSVGSALEDTAGEHFSRSELPAEVRQPVQVVQAQQFGDGEGDFSRSELPAEVRQPVQVAVAQRYGGARTYDTAQPETPAPPAPPPANGTARPQPGLLALKEADYADDTGSDADPESMPEDLTPQVALDYQEMYRIMREVAAVDSGDDLYSAVAADVEFTTPGQDSYQRRQFGLTFGFLKFAQSGKHLGSLLTIMKRREPDLFAEIFGPDHEALLTTLTAATPQQRLAPAGGEPLWSTNWMARFRASGNIPAFQAAQNEEAIENLFRPMLFPAYELGFVTDRGLAMVFDRVVTRGLGGGLRWVVQAAGILRTARQRAFALQALNYADTAAFQRAAGLTPPDGRFTPQTHAALVGVLRQEQLLPLPTTAELMRRLVDSAQGAAKTRLTRLMDSPNFEDVIFALESSS